MKISNHELASSLSVTMGVSKAVATRFLEAYNALVLSEVKKGNQVRLNGIGTFYPQIYETRKGLVEFGRSSSGETRRAIRFRTSAGINRNITVEWPDKDSQIEAFLLAKDEERKLAAARAK